MILSLSGYSKANLDEAKPIYETVSDIKIFAI